MSLHVGEAVGDYRVIGIIGAGGMGQVFQVEHKITKRKEAMKVLIADLADDTQVQRFKREIEVPESVTSDTRKRASLRS